MPTVPEQITPTAAPVAEKYITTRKDQHLELFQNISRHEKGATLPAHIEGDSEALQGQLDFVLDHVFHANNTNAKEIGISESEETQDQSAQRPKKHESLFKKIEDRWGIFTGELSSLFVRGTPPKTGPSKDFLEMKEERGVERGESLTAAKTEAEAPKPLSPQPESMQSATPVSFEVPQPPAVVQQSENVESTAARNEVVPEPANEPLPSYIPAAPGVPHQDESSKAPEEKNATDTPQQLAA